MYALMMNYIQMHNFRTSRTEIVYRMIMLYYVHWSRAALDNLEHDSTFVAAMLHQPGAAIWVGCLGIGYENSNDGKEQWVK